MAQASLFGMTGAFIASAMLFASASEADDLQALKQAARRYVVAMKAVLSLPRVADCSEISWKSSEYAAAKVAYYKAARRAMPSLLQMARGEKTDIRYGEDLIALFRGSGEEDDEEATVILLSKLRACENINQHIQERKAVEDAQKIAEQFLKDFGRLEGA
jgi:hypothetical protein